MDILLRFEKLYGVYVKYKGKEVDSLLKLIKYEFTIGGVKVPFHPNLLRVDDLDFNTEIVNKIMKASDK